MSSMAITYNFGNRCGYKRDKCRGYKRKHDHKDPPPLITVASHAILDFFFHPTKYLDKLNFLTGKYRQQRAERREAIAGVLGVLVNYCHVATLAVGTYHKDGSLNNLKTGFIATALKYGVKRVYRALKDLAKAGYIKIVFRVIDTKYGLRQTNDIQLTRQVFLDLKLNNVFCEVSEHYKRNSDPYTGNARSFLGHPPKPNPITVGRTVARNADKKNPASLSDKTLGQIKSGNRLQAALDIINSAEKERLLKKHRRQPPS